MPYDPDPRKLISHEFHRSLLYAFHEQGHLLSDLDSDCLQTCIMAYHDRRRVTRFTFRKAKDILRELHNRS